MTKKNQRLISKYLRQTAQHLYNEYCVMDFMEGLSVEVQYQIEDWVQAFAEKDQFWYLGMSMAEEAMYYEFLAYWIDDNVYSRPEYSDEAVAVLPTPDRRIVSRSEAKRKAAQRAR